MAASNQARNLINRAFPTGAAFALALACPAVADAKQYVDYTPAKGVWEINAVEVDPNHVDDYLTGLRRSYVPLFEVLKKRGIIDDYRFVVRNGYTKGSPNVLIESHYVSAAMPESDKARDMALEKEMLATVPEDQQTAAIAGYEKYRQFVDEAYWTEMTIPK